MPGGFSLTVLLSVFTIDLGSLPYQAYRIDRLRIFRKDPGNYPIGVLGCCKLPQMSRIFQVASCRFEA